MTKARTLANFVSGNNPLADGTIDPADINGVTATAAELNILDGATVTTTELNYLDGVTSDIQTQFNNISVTTGSLTKSFANGETASITLSQAISPAPVVSVTKEVPQTGISSKGEWDVATDGSNYDRHDTAYNVTLTPVSEGWDISTASFVQSFSVAGQDTVPLGLFFKPDGLKMYVIGATGDDANEYNLSTAWDISTASFLQNFSVAAQETTPTGIFFKSDGLKMYVSGASGDDINEYDLSTAWDISTASFFQSFSLGVSDPQDVFFKPDGAKMYVVEQINGAVREYDLSTSWDVSTASFFQSFSVAAQETTPTGIFFKSDGTKLYVIGSSGDDINEYDLSTAWNVSTASFVQSFSIATQEVFPSGIFFKPDGSKMYVVGFDGDDVNEYDLDVVDFLAIGSGSFASTDVGKQIEGNGGKAILTATDGSYSLVTAFNDNSTIAAGEWGMFALTFDATNGVELSGTFSGYDIAGATFAQSFSVATQDLTPNGVSFKPDGTKMYVVGAGGDAVYEYNLSTAWDVSTSAFLQSFSVSAQETIPEDLFFKPDGTKMYVIGIGTDRVYEYNLSTAWDISTASILQNFSVSGQDTSPEGLYFKPDGTKMYVSGRTGQDVNEYNLSTAWDVSTASFLQNFSVAAQETSLRGLFLSANGTKMFVVGDASDSVNEYNLSTSWDISTASFAQAFSVAAQDGAPRGLFFREDGIKMYVVGSVSDSVYEYDTGSFFQPTAQYSPAITNAGGRINTTYWTDINSMTADQIANDGQVFYAVSTDGRTTWSVIKDADGVRPIVRNNAGTWEYNSNATYGSVTWTAATTNEELYALQQALTDQAQNRMDKAQLDAVTDPNHYTLGNSLDLMIALYLGSNGTSPTSDGVSINYDAQALNQGAVLGTDYDFDFPDSTTVRITSNAAQNLKIRVV